MIPRAAKREQDGRDSCDSLVGGVIEWLNGTSGSFNIR
jgi:hypothetical protein